MREDENRETGVCPRCGTSLAEIRRTGLFGCTECFNVFRAEALAMAERTQGTTVFKGKGLSAGAGKKYGLLLKVEQLRGEIERALREERYSEAEEMQKQLKEIHHKLYGEET